MYIIKWSWTTDQLRYSIATITSIVVNFTLTWTLRYKFAITINTSKHLTCTCSCFAVVQLWVWTFEQVSSKLSSWSSPVIVLTTIGWMCNSCMGIISTVHCWISWNKYGMIWFVIRCLIYRLFKGQLSDFALLYQMCF